VYFHCTSGFVSGPSESIGRAEGNLQEEAGGAEGRLYPRYRTKGERKEAISEK